MADTDARPVPKKNVAYRHYFAIRKNDGSLITTWAGMDSQRSLDGATMAACSNEAVEIATNSGCGYLDLTQTEMNVDAIVVKVTVTNTCRTHLDARFPSRGFRHRNVSNEDTFGFDSCFLHGCASPFHPFARGTRPWLWSGSESRPCANIYAVGSYIKSSLGSLSV